MSSATSEVSSGLPTLLEEQQKHLDLINHLISHSELLVVVYGPKGSGKSLLSRSICVDSDDSVCLTSEQIAGLEDLLDVFAQLWNLPSLPEDLKQARSMVVEESESSSRKDSPLKIIIDDADKFAPKLLKSIIQFALEISGSVNVALFGVTGFADKLQNSFKKLPLYIYELTPLTLEGTKELIIKSGISLSDDEYQTLYQVSDNWPGAMLEAAQHAVDPSTESIAKQKNTQTEEQKENSAKKKEGGSSFGTKHIFALAGLATLLVMMLIYSQNYEKNNTTTLDLSMANTLPESDTNAQDDSKNDYNYSTKKLDGVEAKKEAEVIDLREESQDVPSNNEITDSTEESLASNKMKTGLKADEPSNIKVNITSPVVEKKKASRAKPLPSDSSKKEPKAITSGFVIQLFGSYDLQAAKKLKDTIKLKASVSVYSTRRNQRSWYISVLGPYPNKAEAQRNIKLLPESVKSQSPWIRATKGLTLVP